MRRTRVLTAVLALAAGLLTGGPPALAAAPPDRPAAAADAPARSALAADTYTWKNGPDRTVLARTTPTSGVGPVPRSPG
ncbi:hypothetical protein SHIRM173S_04378 [Streptomyces hirsutus]